MLLGDYSQLLGIRNEFGGRQAKPMLKPFQSKMLAAVRCLCLKNNEEMRKRIENLRFFLKSSFGGKLKIKIGRGFNFSGEIT